MRTRRSNLIVAGAGAAVVALAMWALAGPLDPPPGQIRPTYKTLTEVEPRECVQALPGDQQAVHVITQDGSYYLTADIVAPPGKHGIRVMASRVTLDLRGFSIRGAQGAAPGPEYSAVFVGQAGLFDIHSGIIIDWPGEGIGHAATTDNIDLDISGLQFKNNHRAVAVDTEGCLRVKDCTISGSTFDGIKAGATTDTIITGCCIDNCGWSGIKIERGIVRDCSTSSNGTTAGYGIDARNAAIEGCTVRGNTLGGLFIESCSVSRCLIKDNQGNGILSTGGSRITGNTCIGNFGPPGLSGIALTGPGCTVMDNTISGSDKGITVTTAPAVNNLVARNTITDVTTPLDIAAGNAYGPLINVSAGGDISAVSGAEHPWANFLH